MRKEIMKTLLFYAVKEHGLGDPEVTLSYFEEHLTPDEYRYLKGYLEWVNKDLPNRTFGPANYDKRIAAYEKSLRPTKPSKPPKDTYHYQVTLKVLVSVDPSALNKDLTNEREVIADNTHDLIRRYGVEDVSAVIKSYKLIHALKR